MKFFNILLLIVLSCNIGYSQTDPNTYLTWQQLIKQYMQDGSIAADAKVQRGQLIVKTIQMVNEMSKIKNTIGTMAATVKDLTSMTDLIVKDLNSISAISENEMNNIKEFFDFRDALEGRGYQSIGGFTAWYADETARFRDSRGEINGASAIMNAVSVEHALNTYRAFQYRELNMYQRYNPLFYDKEIMVLLKEARSLDRQARLAAIMFNVALIGNNTSNTLKNWGGKGFEMGNVKVFGKDFNLNQNGLNDLRKQIFDLSDKAQSKFREAQDKYWQLLAMERHLMQLGLSYQRLVALERNRQAMEREYLQRSSNVNSKYTNSNKNSEYNNWKSIQQFKKF